MSAVPEILNAGIMLCAPGEVFGGVETQILGLCDRLRGVCSRPPSLVLFHDRELAAKARERGFEPIVIEARHRYDPSASGKLAALVAREGADLLHVHGYRAMVTAAIAGNALGVPVVKTEHGLPEPDGGFLQGAKTRLNHRLDVWATRRARAAVCYVTADIMSRYDESHRGLRRCVIHNGIEPLDPADTTRPEELEPGYFHVGVVGRVSEIKGIDFALRALAGGGAPRNVRMHVIGTGPLEEALRGVAARLGLGDRIAFHGFRRDVYDWLAHLDALLMPSYHEGLPYTLLEAMSLGTPVAASRVGGLAEVLRDGETGLLMDVGDVDGIAAALDRLVNEPGLARRLGENAAREQRACYDMTRMLNDYADVYRELIG